MRKIFFIMVIFILILSIGAMAKDKIISIDSIEKEPSKINIQDFKSNITDSKSGLIFYGNNQVCTNALCEIIFPVRNVASKIVNWSAPIFSSLEGETLYIQENFTTKSQPVYVGDVKIEVDHNGTKDKITVANYTFNNTYELRWIPVKTENKKDSKYGSVFLPKKNISIENTITYFKAVFKNIFKEKQSEFDIDTLDPNITASEYKGGNDGTNSFVGDINTTASEAVTIAAGSVSIGTGGSSPFKFFKDTFDNSSIVQYDNSENGQNTACSVNAACAINLSGNMACLSVAGGGDAGCIRRPKDYSANGEPFNISFTYRVSISAGDWVKIGTQASNVTVGSFSDHFFDSNGGTPTCAGGTFGFGNINGENRCTSLDCPPTNSCPVIIEHTSKGANETRVVLYVNGTASSNFSIQKDIRNLDYFMAGQHNQGTQTIDMDDIVAYNGSSASIDPTVGYARSVQFKANDYVRRFAYNATFTGADDVVNISCDSGRTWSQGGTANFTKAPENTLMFCPSRGGSKEYLYDVNVSSGQDLTSLNISIIYNADPNTTLVGAIQDANGTVRNSTFIINITSQDGENDTINWTIYGGASAAINTTVLASFNNTATNKANYTFNSIKDGDTWFWKTSVRDSFNDGYEFNSTMQNFTINTTDQINASRFYQYTPARAFTPGTQGNLEFEYWVAWSNNGSIIEKNRTFNKSMNGFEGMNNASAFVAYSTSSDRITNITVNSSLNTNDISIKQSINLTNSTCNAHILKFNLTNAVNVTAITTRDDTSLGFVTAEIRIENNLHNISLNDLKIDIASADLPHWTDRLSPLSSITISLLSGQGASNYQNTTISQVAGSSSCQESVTQFTTDILTGNNTLLDVSPGINQLQGVQDITSTFSATSTGIAIRQLDIGGSVYLLRIKYLYSTGATVGGGGGGGGGETINIFSSGNSSVKITNIRGTNIFDYIIPPGAERSDVLLIQNNGTVEDNISITCEDLDVKICEVWVTLNQTKVGLKPSLKEVEVPFKIEVPSDIKLGTYFFNLRFKSGAGINNILKIKVKVSETGIFLNALNKLTEYKTVSSPFNGGKPVNIPIWSAVLGTFIISTIGFAGTFIYILELKNIGAVLSLGISTMMSLLILIVL